MLSCPHCQKKIELHKLPHPSLFSDFRVCPDCAGKFTTDAATKKRQAVCLIIAVVSLVVTSLWYFRGEEWLFPALVTYIILGLLIYHGNRQVFLVAYGKGPDALKSGTRDPRQ